MAENEPIAPKLIHFRFPVTRDLMDDVTKIVAEMNLEHDRQMRDLSFQANRWRRQRNGLAVMLISIGVKSYLRYRREMKKPLDTD